MPGHSDTQKQVLLIVLDGWGHRVDTNHNAIAEARTPFFDSLFATYPHALLEASGQSVGLPEGQIGNSEVGHMTIGSGTIIDTDLVQITKAFREGSFASNPAFLSLVEHIKKHDSTLHLLGLVSSGGVHSHNAHLAGLLSSIKASGITKVAIHAFTDGRDTPPTSGVRFIKELEELLSEIGIGRIASASGRFYAMDRDQNWDRLAKVEEAIWNGKGRIVNEKSPSQDLKDQYLTGVTDEHLEPTLYANSDGSVETIQPHDGILMWNYRPDRSRMLAERIESRAKDEDLCLLTFTRYEQHSQALVAFTKGAIATTIAKEVSLHNRTQVHIAETEKYAHATYFLNGGVEDKYPGEEHIMIESRKDVPTHDLAPKMRAKEIADATLEQIEKGTDFLFVNFANSDMVGHTANKEAIVIAIEEVDLQLSRVIPALLARGGVAFITSDHGNAETNRDSETGDRHTAHTENPVPAIITTREYQLASTGGLADIAPTTLSLLHIPIPAEMTGKNLLQ